MKPEKFKTQKVIRAYLFLFFLIVLSCYSCAPDATSIELTRVKDTLYKICVDDFVNLVAFIGPEGVMLVDTGFDESSGQVKSILKKLGGGDIEYIINTHSDYDHIAGNSALRGNAIVLAHTRCRSQLLEYADPEYDIPFDKALFRGSYPTITFEEPVTLYFNGEEIQVIPLTGGHTDEDVIVYFKNSGVVCLGDMISPGTFPVVKLNNGGNANSLVENVERLISLFPEDVTFIVGHGGETTVKELRTYHDMLQGTIAIVQAAMKANMTVEEMKRRNILKDWSSFNDPKFEETTAETWIETIYRSSEEKTNEIKEPVLKGLYLGQKPPGKNAELFAPELINYEVHGSPFISQDEKEIIIGSMTEGPKYYKMIDGVWSLQAFLPFAIPENCNGMFVSPSGRRIYFLIWEDNDENFYSIEKKGNKWTTLRSLGEEVNSFPTHWQFTTAKNENLYFSSEGNVVVSVFNGSTHLAPVPLKLENNENLEGGTPYIAPDESYLIYSSGRNERDEYTDLYISYRSRNNKWTEPINIGSSINIKNNFDLCPKISPNGKYLFFISRRNSPEFRIYWADAGFIETLKPDELK